MYDINKLRRELADKPKQLQLLNLIHLQIAHHENAKKLVIEVPRKEYSSKLKKTVLHIMGYDIKYHKIQSDEITIEKI